MLVAMETPHTSIKVAEECVGVRAINNILSSSKEMTRKTNCSDITSSLSSAGPVNVRGHFPRHPSRLQIFFYSKYSYDLDVRLTYFKAALWGVQLCYWQ